MRGVKMKKMYDPYSGIQRTRVIHYLTTPNKQISPSFEEGQMIFWIPRSVFE